MSAISARLALLCCTALTGGALLSACAAPQPAGNDEVIELPSKKAKAPPAPRVFSNDQDAVGAIGSSGDIRLLVWNVHKGRSDAWIGDFRTLSADSDLVLLQEAHMDEEFSQGLAGLPRWDMVEAWRWRVPTGVLTASVAEPLRVSALEHREPMLRTDKSALVTEYRLQDSPQTLLVANIHAINFTVDTRAFREQLIAVADLLDEHDGPVILSGDFNTWREERRDIVDGIVAELGLAEVPFSGPRRQFRQHPLDHVFYRDLDIVTAGVMEVDSSDHNPLQVTFRQRRAPAAGEGTALAITGPIN